MIEKLLSLLAHLAAVWLALGVGGFVAKLMWLSLVMGWDLL